MRILIFNWRDTKHEWAGGGERYVHEIAKRWAREGNHVTLFCGQGLQSNLPKEEIIDRVHIVRRGGRFSVYFWAVWYYLTRFRRICDVVVDIQNGIPFFTPLYSRKPKIAIVYHIHGEQFFIELPFPYNVIGYTIERFIFPLIYIGVKVQAISKTTKDDLTAIGIKEKNIKIVYCGINGKNRKKIHNYKKFTTPTILYLGRIRKYKRVDLLVRIMPEIIKHVPTAHLLIAGWGTEASSVTDISMRNRLRKRIRIVGPVNEAEKRRLLQRAWVFVNPSINEGWGISVIEANLYGTPAVAYRVKGLSESIQDGKTGKLVESDIELVEAIVSILKNKKLRNELGSNAQCWAASFSWDTASKESERLLIDVTHHIK